MTAFSDAIDDFLADSNLASDAILTVDSGPVTISVILTLETEIIDLGGDVRPMVVFGKAGCRTLDSAGVKRGDSLEIAGVSYRVLSVENDDTGWTTLFLGKSYA